MIIIIIIKLFLPYLSSFVYFFLTDIGSWLWGDKNLILALLPRVPQLTSR